MREESSLRAKRSNPEATSKTGLLRRFAPRNDAIDPAYFLCGAQELSESQILGAFPYQRA
jgi:hypothetical protein